MEKEDEIRLMAYNLWVEEGRLEGRDQEYWFKAEAIWRKTHSLNPVSVEKKQGPAQTVKQGPKNKKARWTH
jgi:hypothetical protein